MKKIYFGLIIALVLCSCTKTELTGIEAGEMIIGASMEVYPSISKAALSDTDGSLTWQTGDVIEVATSEGHAQFNLKTGAGTASATFSANYSGTLGDYATYPADIFDSESKIKIPASREWSEGNTNCSMFGSVDGDNVAFKHLGGVVKVTLNGVPANAKKFVFSTPGKKITGEFDFKTGTDNIKYIETADDSGNANSSYTLSFNLSEAKNMAFYIPLPCGTYPKFAFKLLGNGDTANPLYEFEGISGQTVGRKDILIMPASTIGAVPDGGYLLTSVPSDTVGEYILPKADSVILYFEGKQNPSTEDEIKLKYADGSQLPKKLCLKVKDGNKVNVSGDLPDTHVEFDQGEIVTASLKTSATTFKIIAPAKISEKLVVKGGNVEITGGISGGDNVKAIEVAADATADGSSAPVQITIADNATIGTSGTGGENGGITTSANVVIVNNTDAEVNVAVPDEVKETVKVASAGTGTGEVKRSDNQPTTNSEAVIGTQNFFTLSDAIKAAIDNASYNDVIVLCKDIIREVKSDNSDRETYVISNKTITLDLNGHTIKHRYGLNKYGVFEVMNSTLTIVDSSTEKNGKIADTYAQAVLYVENSNVNLKNGILAAEYSNTSSTNYRVVKLKNSTFTMDGGSVLAATTGNYNRAFEFVHSTGTNSKVIVNNGVIKTHTSYAVVFYGDSDGYQGENNTVEINGGEISTAGNFGWLGDDLFGEIVMNGGSFTSNWHQVVDSNTKFTHNGGTVNIKSN